MTGFRYDPFAASFQQTLYDDYRTMRDEHPVYVDPDGRFMALSRFDDVWDAVHDHERFSSDVDEARGLLPMMIYFDPPRHSANRALVSRAFTPRRIAGIESIVSDVAARLCDELAEVGEFDFQHRYAAPLPAMVVGRLIGVPDDMIGDFARWTETFLEINDAEQFAANAASIYEAFNGLLAERRARPTDDLMSALLAAEIDGDRLSAEELLGFCMLLILAGNDTTSSLIGNGLVLLDRHPEQRDRLRADPTQWPAAIEEMLRYDSPAQSLPRTTTIDVECHGTIIPAGTRVLLLWGAANHDEREFDDPERFDIDRSIRRHLALGHGIHHCLGANLARLEARVAFTTLFDRFDEIRLTDEPTRVVSHWARAHSRVPVALG